MSRTSAVLVGLSVIAIGLGVPGICLYASLFYGFNYVAAAIVAIVAILFASIVAIIGIINGPLGRISDDSPRYEKQRLRAFREHQKATLQDLDEIIGVLGEIRDLLRSVED